MIQVTRGRGSLVKGTHCLYEVGEELPEGITPVYWRLGMSGDWVISDDGWVLELLSMKEYYDGRRSKISRFDVYSQFYYFGCARVACWAKRFDVAYHLRGMGALDGKTWGEKFVCSGRGRQWIKIVAMMMINQKMDLMAMGVFLGFDKSYPDSTLIMVKRFLRNPVIENAIVFQMSEFLQDKGITFDQVIEDYKSLLKDAKEEKKINEAIKILEKFERWTGLESKIAGDRIDHAPGQDLVGHRIQKLLEAKQRPENIPGGGKGMKIPASGSAQVFDADGNRLEFAPVSEEVEAARKAAREQGDV